MGENGQHGTIKGVDIISSLPDEILQHILSFLWIKLAITTSVLSRRWRLVWCGTPFVDAHVKTPKLIETLTYYRPPKKTTFHLGFSTCYDDTPHIDSLIESAISHNVEKLVLMFGLRTYTFSDVFYLSSSLKHLSLNFYFEMIPRCTVSWKSLETLSLFFGKLSDESIANILSGCPKLQSLKLHQCGLIQHLDLRKSLSLKRLVIDSTRNSGPVEIVAPHIHYLKLTNSYNCTLVDVSSLTQAYLVEIMYDINKSDFLQIMVLNMLAKFWNVERLTLTTTLLLILSLAEVRGISFPTLKVSTLIVETVIVRYVIPGIARLLQNSPGLKKLVVVHTTDATYTHPIQDKDELDSYLKSQTLNLDQCWRSTYEMFPSRAEIFSMFHCKGATSKLLASFMELVMRNAHDALETMVVQFKKTYRGEVWFEQLLQMPPTLPHRNNVSIVLNRKNNYSLVASVSK